MKSGGEKFFFSFDEEAYQNIESLKFDPNFLFGKNSLSLGEVVDNLMSLSIVPKVIFPLNS